MLAILFIGALFMLIGNILSDICVAFVDPASGSANDRNAPLRKWKLDPGTLRKIMRFRQIRRGYVSFWILCVLILMAGLGPVLVGNRASPCATTGWSSVLSGSTPRNPWACRAARNAITAC
ncbi:MAG: hypothetical protein U1F77_05830 [Kiritimatiellia bacterium]